MTNETLALEGGTLAYLRSGEGPLIVFSHALGPLAWGHLDQLAQSCTVVVPDWERSNVPVRTMAGLGWFEALAAEHDGSRATLCAWSMAGPAAVYYAAERPECLDRLVLVDIAGLRDDFLPLRLRDLPHLLMTWFRGHPTRGYVRCLWKDWVHQKGIDTRPLVEATYRFFRDTAPAFEPSEDETEGEEEDDEDDDMMNDALPEIEVPTLVLSGRHSTVMGPALGATAADKLPHGEHVEFVESAHALQLEEPMKFQEVVAAFIEDPRPDVR